MSTIHLPNQVASEYLRIARCAQQHPHRRMAVIGLRAHVRNEYVGRVADFLGGFAKVGQRTLEQAAMAVWAVHVTFWKAKMHRALKLRIQSDLR